jgi:hypothetical protein
LLSVRFANLCVRSPADVSFPIEWIVFVGDASIV